MTTTLKACNVPILAAEVDECICIQGSMIGRADTNGPQGSGLNNEVSFTLNTIDRHAVAYDARNGTLNTELSGTLQAKESGGWSLNYINPVIESSNPANNHAVAYTFGKTSRPHFKGDAPTYRQLDTANTVNTFDTGESRANELAVQGVPPHYIVRRLMPIECGRLQGFPDGWGATNNSRRICRRRPPLFGGAYMPPTAPLKESGHRNPFLNGWTSWPRGITACTQIAQSTKCGATVWLCPMHCSL